jgi:WD40 repeat protein/nucleoside phosphorylase
MPARTPPRTVPLDRSKALNALHRISPHLPKGMARLADDLAKLLEVDGTASVDAIHKALFPAAEDTASASAQLSKLLKTIDACAEGEGVLLKHAFKGAKREGVAKRRLYFAGPRPALVADTEGLNAIPPQELIPGQTGQRLVDDRRVILLTFNDHEYAAVRKAFYPMGRPPVRNEGEVSVDDLGVHGGLRVLHCHSRQGNRQSQRVTTDLERAYEPLAIIAVGIAFGVDEGKQTIGDVLISEFICDYEPAKASKDGTLVLRGPRPPASPRLFNALKELDLRERNCDESACWPTLRFGGLLSGDKLIDNQHYRDQLQRLANSDQFIGGEMEGAGIYAALAGRPTDWIVVKAICDWADGRKAEDKERRQQHAAANAAQVVKALLDTGTLYQDHSGSGRQRALVPPQLVDKLTRARQLARRQHLPEASGPGYLVEGQGGLRTELDTLMSTPEQTPTEPPTDRPTAVAFDDIIAWAKDPDDRPLYALLGEYGMGKTTTCQRVTAHLRELHEQGQAVPLPLYFDLRKVERVVAASAYQPGQVPTLQESIEDCLRHGYLQPDGGEPLRYEQVLEAIDEGALVIFDGLDEVLSRIGDKQGLSFTANLLKLLPEAAARAAKNGTSAGERRPPRVLLSCRTQFFRNLAEQHNHFTGEHRGAQGARQYRALVLLPFGDEEIRAYLKAVFPDEDVQQLMSQVESVHNLRELASRPFTLKLVAQFIPRIEQWRAAGRRVTGATLYREVAREWLIRDKQKQSFQPEDKEQLAGDLAAHLWRNGQRGLSARELEAWLGHWLAQQAPHADFQTKPRELLQEDLRNSTFLKRQDGERPEDSRFEFAHTSLQEFFLADYLLRALRSGETPSGPARQRWALPMPSNETLDFLGQMLAEEGGSKGNVVPGGTAITTLSSWRAPYLAQASELQTAYALRAYRKGWPMPTMAGIDLQGADLSEWHFGSDEGSLKGVSKLVMTGANLQGTRLRRSRFLQVILDDANFTGAVATQAEFLDCSARRTNWGHADIAGSLFRRTQLESARFDHVDRGLAHFLHCSGMLDAAPKPPGDSRLALNGGHCAPVLSCTISPDGRWLASGSGDVTLRLWDTASGECVRVLRGHEGGVSACAFSPDGRSLASATFNGTLRVWDTASGECVRELRGHESGVIACAFSPDGHSLASGAVDGTLRLWDVASGECVRELRGHKGWVRACAFSPDGRSLASGARDGTLRLWDVASGECVRELRGHKGGVRACAFSPDGHSLASGAVDGTLRLWDVASGECVRELRGHADGVSSFSPDGRLLASAAVDGTLRLWDVASGECVRELRGHKGWAQTCAFSPDGRSLASGAVDGTLRLWDVASGECVRELRGYEGWVSACAFSPDGRSLASAADDNTVRLWDVASGECGRTLHAGRVLACTFSPDGRLLASGVLDGALRVWDVVSGECARALQGFESASQACAFSPDGHLFACGAREGTLRVWDVTSGECKWELRGHEGWVSACAFSPDGRSLASLAILGTLRLWDVASGECVRELRGHADGGTACAFSPDGRSLASGAVDGTLRLWDVASGECVRELRGHKGGVSACAFSPDGRSLASAADDGTLRVWDVASGECVRELRGHESGVIACAFSPDGRSLASGARDGTLRLWVIATGECTQAHLHVRQGSAAWRPNENRLLYSRGRAWRSLGWFGRNERGEPAVWPLEAVVEGAGGEGVIELPDVRGAPQGLLVWLRP